MLDLYAAETRIEQNKARLNRLSGLAWRWFGSKSFCERCLEEQMNRSISLE